MIIRTAGIILALAGVTTAAGAQTRGPVPLPPPTVYSAPMPAPLSPPVNPGPAIVPSAGLSPLLSEPGPIYPQSRQPMPAYPAPQLPGPTGQQNMRSYRNSLVDQQRQLERSGVSPSSERSREIQQQLDQPSLR